MKYSSISSLPTKYNVLQAKKKTIMQETRFGAKPSTPARLKVSASSKSLSVKVGYALKKVLVNIKRGGVTGDKAGHEVSLVKARLISNSVFIMLNIHALMSIKENSY